MENRPIADWRKSLNQVDMRNFVPMVGRVRSLKSLNKFVRPEAIAEGAASFGQDIARYQQGLKAIARQKAMEAQQMIQRRQLFNSTSPEQRAIERIKAFMASRPR